MENSKRDQIFEAAVRVFEREGFRKATMEDIAAEAKASKSLIFYHYKNKFELLALLYQRVGSLLFADMGPVLADEALPPVEKIRRVIEIHVGVAIAQAPVLRIYFRDRNEVPPDIQEQLIAKGERRYIAAVERVIQEGIDAGAFAPCRPRVLAYTILGACNWLTQWYEPRKRSSLDAASIAEEIQNMVLRGLQVRPARR